MTRADIQQSIVFINKIIASNNPRVAVAVLKQHGYQTQYDIISADQIEGALLNLYTSSPVEYVQAIKQIPYISDITNWTTSPDTKEKIKSIAKSLNINTGNQSSKTDWSSLWEGIKDGISTTITTMGGGSTTISTPLISPWVAFLVLILAIAAILFLVLKFGKQTTQQ